MKKILILIIILIIGVAYFTDNLPKTNPNLSRYSDPNIGLEFVYETGPDGYVVDERMPVDLGELVKVIILHRTEDTLKEPPMNGEGSPTITISVLTNDLKESPRTWADKKTDYSNINLKTGDVQETMVGGEGAIRYMSDGLYASENVITSYGDYIYVITGQFIDSESDIRQDFQPILDSIRFIKNSSQE